MEVKKKGLTALMIILALALAVAACARATPTPVPATPVSDELLNVFHYEVKTATTPPLVSKADAVEKAITYVTRVEGEKFTSGARTAARYVLLSSPHKQDFPAWVVTVAGCDVKVYPASCGPGGYREERRLAGIHCPVYDTVCVIVEDAVHGDISLKHDARITGGFDLPSFCEAEESPFPVPEGW